jgi:hypothetical protein
LDNDDITNLTYPNVNNVLLAVPLAHQQKLRITISMFHHWSLHLNRTVDLTTITMADYDEYRITGYRPGVRLIPTRNNQNGVNGANHPP